MSASEPDISESSNLESPSPHSDSPYSSPSQQVPQLANFLTVLSCGDNKFNYDTGNKPFLRIIEQPQNHFRFRYKSEMVGTHGSLLGKSYALNKTKTHPTVELVNYNGQARVRCRLAQHNNSDEHPHKLLEDDQDRDVSATVPEHGSYKVGFPGMGIIHTAKKDVANLLYKKYESKGKNTQDESSSNMLRLHCENIAKNINLNIVRLKFSAHDYNTDEEICSPVYSEPIHNMKSAATNDLKIRRMSRCIGRPKGGDDVILLVEKVNKKNIKIRFYELDKNGTECWSAEGHFLQNDVHHQYAIVFRTPPYRDTKITSEKQVMIELMRPSDGRTSEPKEFTYKPKYVHTNAKKRKANSSYSSLGSSGGSINSLSDLPVPIQMMHQKNEVISHDAVMKDLPMFNIPVSQISAAPMTNDMLLGEAMFDLSSMTPNSGVSQQFNVSPMLGQPNIPEPPVLQLNSSEIERLIKHNSNITAEEKKQFCEADWTDYFKSYGDSVPDMMSGMEFIRLVPDSARVNIKTSRPASPKPMKTEEDDVKYNLENLKNNEYSAYYKSEDGLEVKKLVMELCDMIKNKTAHKKQLVRTKLERLFEMRLSNGDTFLHMMLSSNQPSLEYIVKLIDSVKLTHLLNKTNNNGQSVLHLAVTHDLPKLVTFLVSKGCNPMIEDNEGNNVIHYAVICQTCLEPLLDAMKMNQISFDINAYNNEKQTALHLAAIYGSADSTRVLLGHGASMHARDSEARTALHLAAYDDCLAVLQVLLEYAQPSDIDAVDGRGNTALQIVCGGAMRENSIEIVKLLMDKNANPNKNEDNNQPAWRMARDKPELQQVFKKYIPQMMVCEDDIKSEPEDEYESADEGEIVESCLPELSLYVEEVSKLLDASGGWRELAQRLQRDSLLSWYSASPSPTRKLLTYLKDCDDDITSKSLALLLEDMGQKEAASVIRRYLIS
ncbi:Nuclear factor NF-kappa-B p110 subunit [Papilio machaon]|uniref:Nuclear factor NF-kappa-B p110 subunit n=1 Tax=Papilio machaon TaxID=76193 RepID=A0A194RSC1_PAPMA|nr:Nuclear factor NF-kappa-B p110 subunit [Papilio machaon]